MQTTERPGQITSNDCHRTDCSTNSREPLDRQAPGCSATNVSATMAATIKAEDRTLLDLCRGSKIANARLPHEVPVFPDFPSKQPNVRAVHHPRDAKPFKGLLETHCSSQETG